jgi:hypothetical protein
MEATIDYRSSMFISVYLDILSLVRAEPLGPLVH